MNFAHPAAEMKMVHRSLRPLGIVMVFVLFQMTGPPVLCSASRTQTTVSGSGCNDRNLSTSSPYLSMLSAVVQGTSKEVGRENGSVCIQRLGHLLSQKSVSTLVEVEFCTNALPAARLIRFANISACQNISQMTAQRSNRESGAAFIDDRWIDNLLNRGERCCNVSLRNNTFEACLHNGSLLPAFKQLFAFVHNGSGPAQMCNWQKEVVIAKVKNLTKYFDLTVESFGWKTKMDELLTSAAKLNVFFALLSKGLASSVSQINSVTLLICNAISPQCGNDTKTPISSCHGTCQPALSILQSVETLVNVSSEPILAIMQTAANSCHHVGPSTRPCLFPSDERNSSLTGISIASKIDDAITKLHSELGFCFVPGKCMSPLRATPNRDHWDKKVQAGIVQIHGAARLIFQDTVFPLNLSVLPCGRDCVSVGFTASEQTVSRALLTTFSSLAVTVVSFAVVVFFCNLKKLGGHFLHRTVLLLNVTGGLACVPYLFSALYNNDSYLCYSDKTLVTHQPGSHSTCGYLAWHEHFFVLVAYGYFNVLAFGWQRLIRNMNKPGVASNAMSTWWTKYRDDFVGFVAVVVPALSLTVATMAQQGYEGVPVYGICMASLERRFVSYYFLLYIVITLLPAGVCYGLGVRTLMLRHGVLGTLHWIRGSREARKSGESVSEAPQIKSANTRDLKRLSRLLLVFLLLMAVNTILRSSDGIQQSVNVDGLVEKTAQHIECVTFRCNRDRCPPLPSSSPVFFLATFIGSTISLMIMTSWAFSLSLLVNVPGLGAVIRKVMSANQEQSTPATSSSGQGGGESLAKYSRGVSCQDLLKSERRSSIASGEILNTKKNSSC